MGSSSARLELKPARVILEDIRDLLLSQQSADGNWSYYFEASTILPEFYAIVMEKLFPPCDDAMVRGLCQAIIERQQPNGSWGLYTDHPGHFSTTLEAYIALRLSGHEPDEPVLVRTRTFLEAVKSESKLSNLTKVALATMGIIPWSAFPSFPIELIFLPTWFPGNLYEFASFTRTHMWQIIVLSHLEITLDSPKLPEVSTFLTDSHLRAPTWNSIFGRCLERLVGRSSALTLPRKAYSSRAINAYREQIIDDIGPCGLMGEPVLSENLFSMFVLKALGRAEDEPRIAKMKETLRSWALDSGGETRMRYCTMEVWDTALNLCLLRQLGVPDTDPRIERAVRWLLDSQIRDFRYLSKRNPKISGTSWSYERSNVYYPDVDDTCAALNAIRDLKGPLADTARESFCRGVKWLLHMQNRDGGWTAFGHNLDRAFLEKAPFNDVRRLMIEPSVADMTGRTAAFIASLRDPEFAPALSRAKDWLDADQTDHGSWFGRWGISYIYGTWAALSAYGAMGRVEGSSPTVDRACAWLRSVQNTDGGWGESCESDMKDQFVQRTNSNPSQTAWALDGLLSVVRNPREDVCIARALEYLFEIYEPGRGWQETYPTGAGFAGKIYFRYHNYRNLWPAFALLRATRALESGASQKG